MTDSASRIALKLKASVSNLSPTKSKSECKLQVSIGCISRGLLFLCLAVTAFGFLSYTYFFKLDPQFRLFLYKPILEAFDNFYDNIAAPSKDNEGSESLACKFPLLDPWDKSIAKFLQEPKFFNCSQLQPNLSFVDPFNRLSLDIVAFHNANTMGRLNCRYSAVTRETGNDNNIAVAASLPIEPGDVIDLSSDVIEVNCFDYDAAGTAKRVYHNVHGLVSSAEQRRSRARNEAGDSLSVLLFMLESTSLSAFRRSLPRTYAYLTEVMKIKVFKGYNKIADNSFPNMLAIMTGLRADSGDMDMPSEIPKQNYREAQFDKWDLIWKEFKTNGYITGHNEDSPHMGMFNYYMLGFGQQPTDHYYRPFWLSLELSYLNSKSSELCFGNVPKTRLLIDITKRYWKTYHGKLRFLYSFITEISHDNAYDLSMADADIFQFFRDLYEGGFLNNTALIVASDHGHRFSDIRQTLVGLIEERMPMLAIRLPDWFNRKYPEVARSLGKNQMRLLTPFDLHQTLSDLAKSNFSEDPKVSGSRALSILREVPADRTCKSAGIPEQYCTCSESTPIPTNDSLVTFAARFLIRTLNGLLRNETKCAVLALKQVLHAELFVSNQQVINAVVRKEDLTKMTLKESQIKLVRVSIEATPSGGLFEALISHNSLTNETKLQGGRNDISRTNYYGSQSNCVADVVLKKYCYCTR